jgi:hypothetical protein
MCTLILAKTSCVVYDTTIFHLLVIKYFKKSFTIEIQILRFGCKGYLDASSFGSEKCEELVLRFQDRSSRSAINLIKSMIE